MAENTKRSVFGLHGIFGILISIVGLIVILVVLQLASIVTQRHAAETPYDPTAIRDLKQIDVNNKQYAFQAPKKDQ